MKKILIADDEAHIRELVATTLGIEQYEIYEAKNGKEALDKAREIVPDLMLLDVGMPIMDGIEVCRQLKAEPATDGIHIIMLTAYGQSDDKAQGTLAGADDYFIKPFSPTALLDKIHDILKG